jgi:S-adenosylmethionine:tRNA ribosyltransferase-isomerase
MKRINPQSDPLLTDSYDYFLPKELIAKYPVSPKESAKLLVFNRTNGEIIHSNFGELINFIPEDTEIIFNDTKVIKARIFGQKETGGKIELLINRELQKNIFNVFIRGSVRENSLLFFEKDLVAKVIKINDDGSRNVNFMLNNNILNFEELNNILDKIGVIPLPPYLSRSAENSDEVEYQTVFAKERKDTGSVASPTASLHFSEQMLSDFKAKFNINYLTLSVGAGTFKPVDSEKITDHKIHSEYYFMSQKTADVINSDKKILGVGTTVTRTIEHFRKTEDLNSEANIFLNFTNRPQRVDYLLTNFHLPKSTLLMLVESFVGMENLSKIYTEAVDKNYRFYSYGDGMLIL